MRRGSGRSVMAITCTRPSTRQPPLGSNNHCRIRAWTAEIIRTRSILIRAWAPTSLRRMTTRWCRRTGQYIIMNFTRNVRMRSSRTWANRAIRRWFVRRASCRSTRAIVHRRSCRNAVTAFVSNAWSRPSNAFSWLMRIVSKKSL